MRKLGWLVFIGGGLLIVVLLASSFIGPLSWGRSSGSYGWGTGYGMMRGFGFPMTLAPHASAGVGMMGLGMLVFCVLMMGGMMLHGQPFAHGAGSSLLAPQGESNLDILQRRYSQGEITKEQFEEMKRDLRL